MNADAIFSTSQLLLRNSELLQIKRCLMLAPPADDVTAALLSEGVVSELVALTQNFSTYRQLKLLWQKHTSQQSLIYGATLPDLSSDLFDGVIIYLQKSKSLMEFWLAMLSTLMTKNARVWLVGKNSEGIKSWRKRLKKYFAEVVALDSARHCGLIEASGLLSSGKAFIKDDYFQVFDVHQQNKSFPVVSLPGVFSYGRLDKGTAVLLETLEGLNPKKVLDFGCGAGVIGAALACEQPDVELMLVDCDALALESTRKTLNSLQVKRYQVVASDGLSEVSERFDLIISNPPFHQGVKTHYEVTGQFLRESYNYLVKGGELRIVANSFLRYEPIIQKIFGHCRTIDVRNGFSVYSARK